LLSTGLIFVRKVFLLGLFSLGGLDKWWEWEPIIGWSLQFKSGSAFAYENAAPEGMSIQGGVLCKYYLYAAKKYKHSITNAMRQRQ